MKLISKRNSWNLILRTNGKKVSDKHILHKPEALTTFSRSLLQFIICLFINVLTAVSDGQFKLAPIGQDYWFLHRVDIFFIHLSIIWLYCN